MDVLSAGVVIVLLFLSFADSDSISEQELLPTKPCDEALSIEIDNVHLLENGSILADDGYMYKDGDYWIDKSPDNATIYRGCACVVNSCVRKCCPEKHMYTPQFGGKCVRRYDPLLQPFKPIFSDVTDEAEYSKIRFLYGDPCTGKYHLEHNEEFYLYGNGTIFKPAVSDVPASVDEVITPDKYCLEVVEVPNGTKILPFICFPADEEGSNPPTTFAEQATFIIYPIGLILSLPFLLATFVVYAIVPELRNLHGKSLMSHVTSLFFAYLFLAIVQLGGDNIGNGVCVVTAFIVYFSFLASFFWLNVMCFDLWWTFSGFRPLRGSVRERDHKKFVVYSLYSWGCPLFLLTITLIMDLAENIPSSALKPQFGAESCWFKENAATWAYFYGIVAVILTVNLIMFVTTAWKIIQLKRETAMLQGTDSRRHDDDENKQRFSLYLKLFIVMGVNWVMEVVSHAVGGPAYIWYITDIGNTLQGVLIFVIFVWKDKVRKLLVKRFTGRASDSTTQNSSNSASKSTRVYSSCNNDSVKKDMASQGNISMEPISRFEGPVSEP